MSTVAQNPKEGYPGLFTKLGIDVLVAGFSTAIIIPIISSVDRAMVENAAARNTLGKAFMNSFKECVRHPIKFVRSPQFLFAWMVYGSTYVTANLVDSYGDYKKTDVGFAKWLSTSVVNTSTCLIKDSAYAKIFGSSIPSVMPKSVYATWMVRDASTMYFIFTAPPIVARYLTQYTGDEDISYYIAQFSLPLLYQFISTPLHLLGFDIFNNPNNNIAQRLQFLKKDYFKNVSMRMGRMFFPWSVSSVLNKAVRKKLNNAIGPMKI